MTVETELIDGFLEDAEAAVAREALPKAKTLYQGILRLDEHNLEALSQLAAIAIHEEDMRSALSYFQIALERHSREADVYHGLAHAYRALGQDDKALQSLNTALRIEPNHEPALFDKAVLLQKQGDLNGAEQLYLRVASKDNHRIDAIFNRGVVMFRQGNLKAAERWFRQAVKLDPNAPRPLTNLALIYRYRGYLDAAERCLEFVVHHHPDFAEAQWNLANLELLKGDLKEGFARAEWRFQRPGFDPPVRDLPRWDGTVQPGLKLLLVAEQGAGDTIQFIRYAKALAAQGVSVAVEAQDSLAALMANVEGVDTVIPPGHSVLDFDAWLPIMSIPHVLGTTPDTIPADVPYLRPPEQPCPITLSDTDFTVGIVWRGNPKHEMDRFRSIGLHLWAPILTLPGVQFVSLQVPDQYSELDEAKSERPVIDAAGALKDFSRTAAMVSHLDLVISVDTAVAHLAGALGKPVWLLISSANDWRWRTDRSDTPWYPTMRIFRSDMLRRWQSVMSEVAQALEDHVSRGHSTAKPGVEP